MAFLPCELKLKGKKDKLGQRHARVHLASPWACLCAHVPCSSGHQHTGPGTHPAAVSPHLVRKDPLSKHGRFLRGWEQEFNIEMGGGRKIQAERLLGPPWHHRLPTWEPFRARGPPGSLIQGGESSPARAES